VTAARNSLIEPSDFVRGAIAAARRGMLTRWASTRRSNSKGSAKLRIRAYGDLGNGGSDFTYQIVATAGHDFNQHVTLTLGYRLLNVDYDKDNFLMDTTMKGPVVGVMFKFGE
jgi:hypothetical protein